MKFMIANKLVKPDNLSEDLEFVVFCEQGAGDNLMYLRFWKNSSRNIKILISSALKILCL